MGRAAHIPAPDRTAGLGPRSSPQSPAIDTTARSDGRSSSSRLPVSLDVPSARSLPSDRGILDLHDHPSYNFDGKSVTHSDREFC